jgi:PTS system mannitol-specific IIC component
MAGVFTNVVFDSGLISPASPGSIFAILLMTPKGSYIGVVLSVIAATTVSFIVASILLKTSAQGNDEDSLEKASAQMKDMKASSKGAASEAGVNLADVKAVYVACDAGMGSSAMGAGLLRKKVAAASLDIEVTNYAINNLPADSQIVITHKDLTDRARNTVPGAMHMSLSNFLDGGVYDQLVAELTDAQSGEEKVEDPAPAAAPEQEGNKLALTDDSIFLGLKATQKEDAIKFAGEQLVKLGNVSPEYIAGMFAREELVSTYLGESIAVPHGTIEAKQYVQKTGIVFCQYPEGIQWGEDEDAIAKMVIGIAAQGDEHNMVLMAITNSLDDEEAVECLQNTTNPADVLRILNGN